MSKVEFTEKDVDKGEYPHFMLKEIHEQTATITDAMRGRLSREEATAKLGGLEMTNAELRAVERIVITGCGTAAHSALVGEYLIEALAHIPAEVEFASEFRYRNMPLPKDTLVFVMSQSGETADSLAALRESRRKGHRTLGICNNVASTIARESDGGVYMHAGPEIGVAATKSFTSQVTILTLISLLLGRIRHLGTMEGLRIIDELEAIPDKVAQILKQSDHIREIARKYAHVAGDDVPRPAVQLSHRARGSAEDERNLVHPRQRPPERRAKARHHRAHHARSAERLHRAGGQRPGEEHLATSRKSARAKARSSASAPKAAASSSASATTSCGSRPAPTTSPRCSPSSRCNSSPITPPCISAATWISRGIWRRA